MSANPNTLNSPMPELGRTAWAVGRVIGGAVIEGPQMYDAVGLEGPLSYDTAPLALVERPATVATVDRDGMEAQQKEGAPPIFVQVPQDVRAVSDRGFLPDPLRRFQVPARVNDPNSVPLARLMEQTAPVQGTAEADPAAVTKPEGTGDTEDEA